jgi:hypothetical protein
MQRSCGQVSLLCLRSNKEGWKESQCGWRGWMRGDQASIRAVSWTCLGSGYPSGSPIAALDSR